VNIRSRKEKERIKMKPRNPERINRFSDLLGVKGKLESLLDNDYEIEGLVDVFPSRRYEIRSREDLDKAIGSILLYSSPYASMKGTVSFRKRRDH